MLSHYEKKSLLCLFASPNALKTTRTLSNSFLDVFKDDEGWDVTEFNAYEMQVHPCVGCGACAKVVGCKFDDMDSFDENLRNSDLLVIATPVYNFSFPSPLKAILDRFQRYFEARFSLGIKPAIEKHREAVLLLTMGSEDDYCVELVTHQLERAMSVMNTNLMDPVVWSGLDSGDNKKRNVQQKAHDLAIEILQET